MQKIGKRGNDMEEVIMQKENATLAGGASERKMPLDSKSDAKPEKEFSVKDSWISIACFLLGFVFTHFVCENAGGLWGGIFWLLVGVIGAVYVWIKKMPVTKMHCALFAVAEAFCFAPLFCTNGFINTLAAIFSFLLLFYLAYTLKGAELFSESFVQDLCQSVFAAPFRKFSDGFKAVKGLMKNPRAGKNLLCILGGILISVPLTIVVLVLLISSDFAFSRWMDDLLDHLPEIRFLYVFELGMGLLVGSYLFGAFSSSETEKKSSYVPGKWCNLPNLLGYTAVTPICVFYVVYIAVQFPYFVSAFGGTLPEGYSCAEYARRGFFELCIIAMINLGVIMMMQCFLKRKEDGKCFRAQKVYTVAISVITLMLITSALSKMVLYINRFGMTPLRVYTSWFMMVLAVVFLIFIVAQFAEFKFWRVSFTAFAVLLGVLCFSNVDGMIARYNVTAYLEGQHENVDLRLLERLGDAALVHVERLTEAEDELVAKRAEVVYTRMMEESEKRGAFAYFSIPRAIGRRR